MVIDYSGIFKAKLNLDICDANLVKKIHDQLIEDNQFVTICGEQGTGKTSFLCQLAHMLTDEKQNVFLFFYGQSAFNDCALQFVKQFVFYVEDKLGCKHYKSFSDDTDGYTGRMLEVLNQFKEKIYILIDDIDCLSSDNLSRNFSFLPSEGNCSVCVTFGKEYSYEPCFLRGREIHAYDLPKSQEQFSIKVFISKLKKEFKKTPQWPWVMELFEILAMSSYGVNAVDIFCILNEMGIKSDINELEDAIQYYIPSYLYMRQYRIIDFVQKSYRDYLRTMIYKDKKKAEAYTNAFTNYLMYSNNLSKNKELFDAEAFRFLELNPQSGLLERIIETAEGRRDNSNLFQTIHNAIFFDDGMFFSSLYDNLEFCDFCIKYMNEIIDNSYCRVDLKMMLLSDLFYRFKNKADEALGGWEINNSSNERGIGERCLEVCELIAKDYEKISEFEVSMNHPDLFLAYEPINTGIEWYVKALECNEKIRSESELKDTSSSKKIMKKISKMMRLLKEYYEQEWYEVPDDDD